MSTRVAEPAPTAKQRHRLELIALLTPRLHCALLRQGYGPCDDTDATPVQADHVLEVQWLREHLTRRQAAGDPIACLHCGGDGTVAEIVVEQTDEPVERVPCPACDAGAARLDVLIADARNGWLLCPRHHGLKTAALIEIPHRLLRPPVFRFATDYRCEHLLERRPFVKS